MQIRRSVLIAFLLLVLSSSLVAQNSPYGMTIAIPGTLQAEHYDFGGNGVAWFDTTLGNAFGVLRMEDMDVGAIPGGGYHIGALADGEWAEYSVNVATPGTYNVTLRWASDYAGTTSFRLLQGTTLLTTQTVTKTSLTAGDWHRYLTRTFPVTLAGGSHILRIEFTVGAWNFDSLVFAQQTTCTAPAFTAHPTNQTPNQPGLTVNLSGSANNAVSYQWFKDGALLAGKTASTLQLLDVEHGRDGGFYTLRATSSCGATATSNQARVRVLCSASPGLNTRNIERAVAGLPDYCDWTTDISTGFPTSNTDTNGSYNRPVISAAVAFVKEPFRNNVDGKTWDMVNWWTTYLNGELGERSTAWFFGGSEFGSFTYAHFNVVSVMAVYYQATKPGQTAQVQAIGALAQRWLRANFALNALGAAPAWPKTKHSETQFQAMGNPYTGPFVAMAGERSMWSHWSNSHRSILFARAVALPTNAGGEDPNVRAARVQIENSWAGRTGKNVFDAYGLLSGERTTLQAVVSSGTLPSNLVSYYLGTKLRTKTRYHFVAWELPEKVRVTLMEQNAHQFTAPTMGVAYFTNARAAQGLEAHFLYPWAGVFGSGSEGGENITTATGVLDLVNRYIESSNNAVPGSLPHGARTVRISNLPSNASRKYWVTIHPDAGMSPTVQ